jgi:hypothetical protein
VSQRLKKPDYEVLLQLLNNQHANEQRLVRIAYPEAYENTCNTEENTGQVSTGVEIVLQMSHNTLTRAEEYIMREMHLKSEIAQRSLSDLWCGKHTCMPHTKAYNPVL